MCGSIREIGVLPCRGIAQQISPFRQAQFPPKSDYFHSPSAGLASMGGLGAAGSETEDTSNGLRDLYELRRYVIDHEPQRQAFDAFQRDAAIPALNRIGIMLVGVFYPENKLSPIYMLLRHRSTESLLTSTQKLLADAEYLRKGADFLNAPADKPAFQRMESSLLLAF